MEQLTPMMRQYKAIKADYQDAILFYRLGDFYEMFFEDAEKASKELDIVLTARDAGKNTKIPMCGVPFHAAQTYISRLLKKGYKIAICEQVSDPKDSKGIVEREVVKVITPGTAVDEDYLNQNTNNYLVSLFCSGHKVGLAYTDYSTGEFFLSQFMLSDSFLTSELIRLNPAEVICNKAVPQHIITWLANASAAVLSSYPESDFELAQAAKILTAYYGVSSINDLGLSSFQEGLLAAAALLSYLQSTQKQRFNHMQKPIPYIRDTYMALDSATRKNLELISTIKENKEQGSLLWAIDKTVSAMGSRLMKRWVNQPLVNISLINERQEAVANLVNSYTSCIQLRELIKKAYDFERLIGRLNTGNANPLDLLALKQSLEIIPQLKKLLVNYSNPGLLATLYLELDDLADMVKLIEASINPDAGSSMRTGEIIKDGYNGEVDELRRISRDSKQWLLQLESSERERTGIKSLKVGYNKVFGYYIEVTKSNLSLIPQDYQRKQTLANAERYIINELKEFEEKIFSAEERLSRIEQELFQQVKNQIIAHNNRIQLTAAAVAQIDVLTNLAYIAVNNNYNRPLVNESNKIMLVGARHPVIEKLQRDAFVSNDVNLDNSTEMIQIITGPNMAGKSTFARTVALITLLAQIGSFIPAEKGEIGVVDKIFARVGASDDIATGQSTFMVEMNEVANIINNATAKSLIILDEVGRGTSTFDGLSIAWAITEYLHDQIKAKTIFTTHYHELTALANNLPGVTNYNVLVREHQDSINFLYKIHPGCANKSYGIQVARLAGLPEQLLISAKQILNCLEEASAAPKQVAFAFLETAAPETYSLPLNTKQQKTDHELANILADLQFLDINKLTPLEALNYLAELKTKLSVREGDSA
jgi:DNA mismatch repair protein MutS